MQHLTHNTRGGTQVGGVLRICARTLRVFAHDGCEGLDRNQGDPGMLAITAVTLEGCSAKVSRGRVRSGIWAPEK